MDDFFVADEQRVIAPEYINADVDIETSLRPHTLDEYIGQEKAKENLKIYIEAAKNRHESLEAVYSKDHQTVKRSLPTPI